MKKFSFLFMVAAVLMVTGCGKEKLVCTNEQSYGTAKLNTEITVTFDKEYASKTTTKMLASFDEEATAKSFAGNYKDKKEFTVKRDGKKVTVTQTTEFDKKEAKSEDNKKDAIKKYLQESGFKCE